MQVKWMRGPCHLFVKRCLQLVKNVFRNILEYDALHRRILRPPYSKGKSCSEDRKGFRVSA